MQTYTFTVTIEDSGDEFSEQFNPNDEESVADFEESMRDLLNDTPPYWNSTWRLKSVKIDL